MYGRLMIGLSILLRSFLVNGQLIFILVYVADYLWMTSSSVIYSSIVVVSIIRPISMVASIYLTLKFMLNYVNVNVNKFNPLTIENILEQNREILEMEEVEMWK